MGRLFVVELRRILARGLTRWLTLVGAVLIVAAGTLVLVFSPSPDKSRAEARERFESYVTVCAGGPGGPSTVSPRLRNQVPPGGVAPPPTTPAPDRRAACEATYRGVLEQGERAGFRWTEMWPTWPSWPEPRDTVDGFFDLMQAGIMLPALLLMLGGVVAGASMVGADWQAGSFVMLLTWEPRRVRLLLTRLLATALVGFVIALSCLVLFTLVLVPTALTKGSSVAADGDWWVTYATVLLRLAALTGLASAVGGALAMIGKRTALAVFAVVGYLLTFELISRAYWDWALPWLVLRNMALVVGGQDVVPDGGTPWTGLAVLGGWSAVIIVAAAVLFGRRDFASSN